MKMSEEAMQAVRVAASMPSHQNFGRGIVLDLLSHIVALDFEINSVLKASEKLSQDHTSQIERKQAMYDAAIVDIAKHGRTIRDLRQEVEELREGKQVVLPKKVTEAISCCELVGIEREDIPSLLNVTRQLFRDYPRNVIISLEIINEYANAGNRKKLMQALVNGYTVEEPIDKEQRLRLDIRSTFEGWKRGRHIDIVKAVDGVLDNYFKADN